MKKILFVSAVIISLFFNLYITFANVEMDGDFSDWYNSPSIKSQDEEVEVPVTDESEEKSSDLAKPEPSEYKISELKWSLKKEDGFLYFMVNLSHDEYAEATEITTEILSDLGDFTIITTYDVKDETVLSRVEETDEVITRGAFRYANKGKESYLEYGIPLEMLIGDMQWSYILNVKIYTKDHTQPPDKNYLTISTASSGPVVGVVIAGCLAVGGYLFSRKKRGNL